jgi:hypothetical protein
MDETLPESQISLVRCSLRAAADGPYFPEWEFETLIGFPRDRVRDWSARWPGAALDEEALAVAISVLNNLLGYPHGFESKLAAETGAPRAELAQLLEQLSARHEPLPP